MTVLRRKSWHDLRRRPARSAFTVATIAAAVAGLSLFAMPTLMDRAMADRIAEDRLHDVQLYTGDVVLDETDLRSLADVAGVAAVGARTVYPSRLFVGDRREDVLVVGVPSCDDQPVNVVGIDSGTAPTAGEALTDPQNARSGRFSGDVGTRVRVEGVAGAFSEVRIAGRGDTMVFSQVAVEERAVLYAPQPTVNEMAGARGVNTVELLVEDPAEAAAVADRVRARLLELEPGIVFTELPDVREAGTWPGQDTFDNFSTLFYVGAVLALVSALVLISNTMTTMVAEQTREIAVMKAIGGRRRQIVRSFLQTVGILGLSGSLLGVAVGVPFANLLVAFVGDRFFGLDPAWGVSVPVIVIGLLVGVAGATLAALPALRRAARLSVRRGLDVGTGVSGGTGVDRVLRRVRLPHNARVGLRNVARRRARTFGTVVQVGLAAGVALGFLALGVTVSDVTGDTWDAMSWDVLVIRRANVELDPAAGRVIEAVDGVETAHPTLYNDLEVEGGQYESWGLPVDSRLYSPDMLAGRWFAEGDEGDSVAVVGRALATKVGLEVGDTLTVGTARGRADLEVVGIDRVLMNNGTTVYVPLGTFQELLGRTDSNTYWVRSQGQDEPDIDRLAAALEDELTAAGYPVRTEIHYVEREANLADNRVLVGVLAVMGVPIVAIGMIGLVNLMTMNVIERTREIGILRCIGARARDIRRIFRSEALVTAAVGWLIAVPLGWSIGRLLVWIVSEVFDFGAIPYTFPAWYPPFALLVTLALAWLVVLAPVRRAARLRPGDALRYE